MWRLHHGQILPDCRGNKDLVLAIEASENAPNFWPSSSSSLAFAVSSSSFHYYFNKAIRADLLRPSKANFFFLVLVEDLAGLIVDVVASVVVVG